MNQCLRCNRPCSVSAIFCELCLLHLQQHHHSHDQAGEQSYLEEAVAAEDVVDAPAFEHALAPADPSIITIDQTNLSQSDLSSATVLMVIAYADENKNSQDIEQNDFPIADVDKDIFPRDAEQNNFPVDYAPELDTSLQRLNDAARLIAESDPEAGQNGRGPRASRLTPLCDISAEIQRASTNPLPGSAFATQPVLRKPLDEHLPDLWPWLHSTETDEEKDAWINNYDPLQSRQFPSSAESRKIEDEDIQRAFRERLAIVWEGVKHEPQKSFRVLLLCISLLAVIALIADAAMISFLAQGKPAGTVTMAPTLTLSTRFANHGDLVTLRLRNFPTSSSVAISHDIQEQVSLQNVSNIVQVNALGAKDVVLLVEDGWEPGGHTIVAEDERTRYTASAMLVVGVGSTRPGHLELQSNAVNLGPQYQGANSFQTIRLDNSGGGTINWSASSSDAWLLLSPNNGMFSDHQEIQIAADRTYLKPGNYQGKITFFSNVSEPQVLIIQMQVLALPANAGAVMSISPALMSFTAVDGLSDPHSQSLVMTNPGTKALYWTISNQAPRSTSDSNSYLQSLITTTSWLHPEVTSGKVVPGSTVNIPLVVHSAALLPGTYTSVLTFVTQSGQSALNSPQLVTITLTVQPRCGLTVSTGMLTFNALAGQASIGNQVLSLMGNASCSGSVNWNATSSARWLAIAPASGQLKGSAPATSTVTVNPVGLGVGTYSGTITITVAQSTQTVSVLLVVQNPPPPGAPIIGASPLNLNFSVTQGQMNPPGQTITLTNTGASALIWNISTSPLDSWLNVLQSQNVIAPGQTGSLVVNVSTAGLTAGSYSGSIALSGVDINGNPAGGSPQTIAIHLTVEAPCALTLPSASTLAFTATQGQQSNPTPIQVAITASGNCNWPVTWQASYDTSAGWLNLSANNGTFTTSGQSSTLVVSPSLVGLAPGDVHTTIKISATDNMGAIVQGSPQALVVDMLVMAPCSLQSNASSLNFTVTQGQVSNMQNILLNMTGNCSLPVTWKAQANNSWLNLGGNAGSDNGHGSSLGVSVDATSLQIGSYNDTIIFSSTGSGGASVSNTPTIPITVNVVGATVNLTVNSCDAVLCTTPMPFAGANVTLSDSAGNIVASGITDSQGNLTLSNVPMGVYTVTVAGTDVSNVTFTSSTSLTVSGSVVNMTIGTSPSSTPSAVIP
ncbi:BACON domain-containing protein [Dictyobacter arantiisoli]|uniref:BACON domain-containing protein n=1 Tax=Dictyobacter arantiisoli TaxID=2014874 RepID=A0A5A5TCT3_9CHLR|nr:hypothetical protein [Dictyobacter arantiisoli]GCF09331.1 hypothetical protein KDI_28950 [Dictyobacter arantiisoli]